MEYVIDGGRIGSPDEFYDQISRVLIPGSEWGRNLDAFDDILRGGFGTPEGGFTLRWTNSALSRANLSHAETARQLERQLASCHPSNRDDVRRKLRLARSGEGATVFDWLVKIICDHGPGGHNPNIMFALFSTESHYFRSWSSAAVGTTPAARPLFPQLRTSPFASWYRGFVPTGGAHGRTGRRAMAVDRTHRGAWRDRGLAARGEAKGEVAQAASDDQTEPAYPHRHVPTADDDRPAEHDAQEVRQRYDCKDRARHCIECLLVHGSSSSSSRTPSRLGMFFDVSYTKANSAR